MKYSIIVVVAVFLIACKSNKEVKFVVDKTEPQPAEVLVPATESAMSEEIEAVYETAKPQESNSQDIYGSWLVMLITENGGAVELPYLEWEMQFTFDEESEMLVVKSPCNSGSCRYAIDGDLLSMKSNCGFTEMYCEDELKNIWERNLVEMLQNQMRFRTTNDQLLNLEGEVYGIQLTRR